MDSGHEQTGLSAYVLAKERWKKKTLQARFAIGLLTVICSILIVILVVTYESGHHNTSSMDCVSKEKEEAENNSVIKFIHLSDIHYDPFYDSNVSSSFFCRQQMANSTAKYFAPYGRVGCDSPVYLVENSFDAMRNVTTEEDVNFILITGDLSGHKMWTNYSGPERVLDNIASVSGKIHSMFPNIPIFPLIGNNDLPGHYILPNSSNDWYQRLLAYWEPLILCSGCPGYAKNLNLQKSFLEGGYYNASIAGGKIALLVLNSLYWSFGVERSVEIDQKASQQLVWLESQLMLARARGQKAMLASHIPAGVDTYDSKPFWFSNYTDIYARIVVNNYSDTIIGQFFAHTHKDDYRLQEFSRDHTVSPQGLTKSFALIAPSISPVYHNNPAFRIVSIDKLRLSLMDYTQYYMDLVMATEFSYPVWQLDYVFSKKYPSENLFIDTERIYELNQQLLNLTSNVFWKGYVFSRETNYQPLPYNRFTLYCAMKFVRLQNFQECIKKYKVPGG